LKLADFGLKNGINEVIGITKNKWINAAPLGIIVEDELTKVAKLKLFESHTLENLKKGSLLWVNITLDPEIFAIASFEDPGKEFYVSLDPPILKSALAWCEFEVELKGNIAKLFLNRGEIIKNEVRAVNRGFNALIEALVYATKYIQLKKPEFIIKIAECEKIIRKCGSEKEKRAFEYLKKRIRL